MEETTMSSISYAEEVESDQSVYFEPKCAAITKSDEFEVEDEKLSRFIVELEARIARLERSRWFNQQYQVQQEEDEEDESEEQFPEESSA
ncbi:hypothetical protein Csa_011076, partial [Cucumis sativus]